MNKKLLITLLVVLIVIAAAVGGYFYLHNKNTKNDTPNPTSSATPAIPEQQFVTISDTGYSPAAMTVKTGTAITWTNHSTSDQQIIATDTVNGPTSPVMAQNESFTFVFTTAGTYTYSNPDKVTMTGTVTVTP